MTKSQFPFYKRILFQLLLPVVIVGLLVSTLLVTYMSAPLKTYLTRQFDANLRLSSVMGLRICEESFNYLLDLRFEKNLEMNEVMQNETMDKIKVISDQFPDIHLMVLQSEELIKVSSLNDSPEKWTGPMLSDKDNTTFDFDFGTDRVRSHVQFFPFWDWHILSFVFEKDYKTPVQMAYKITNLSAIGVFLAVLCTLLIVFYLFINSPLGRLIRATDGVSDGNLNKIDTVSGNEFGRLMTSFNGMIDRLKNEKNRVRHLIDQLKESEAMFRSQFEYGNIGIAINRADKHWVRANERLCHMLGYAEEELLTKSWKELFAPQDLETVISNYDRMLADEFENYELDAQLFHKNGPVVYTRLSVSCIRNLDRSVKFVIASFVDITERMHAEQTRREANRILRLVLDTIPVRVYWKDRELRYLGGNQSFCEDLGYTSFEELIGKTDHDLAPTPLADFFREGDQTVMATGESQIFFEKPLEMPDGTIKWSSTNKVAMRDESQNIIGILGTYHDISEQKKVEEELLKLRNYLSNIIDSMPSILVGVNKQGLVTQWNMEAKRTTGLSPDQAVGQPLEHVIPRLSSEMGRVHDAIVTRSKQSELKRLRVEKDQTFYENVTVYPLITNGIDGAVIRIDDVTREQQLEDQLNHSRKLEAVGTLAGGIAHDFNNMLGGIIGATELLAFYLPDEPKAQKLHQTILEATTRAADLTKKLLTFSSHNPQASTVVDVHEIINDTLVLLENTIDRRIVLELNLTAESAAIVGDPSQLQNVFLNLGINASQSMPDGGKLSISTQKLHIDAAYCNSSTFDLRPGCYLDIEVRDTGCGIPLEYQHKIFDPFFTTKSQGIGTGLGLAAVYGSVQQHRGAIHVTSEPDLGTVFQILLPLTDKDVAKEGAVKPLVKGSGRILVVDDEQVMRITAQAILEDLGYEVVLAEDGQQAVTIFQKEKGAFDLVILDMVMPVMNGRDCFLQLKEQETDVRVILSSGFAHEKDIQEMIDSGLNGFIRKPYRRANLSQLVHEVLS